MQITLRLLRLGFVALVALPSIASGAPGQLEINATCAVQTGCFPGDAPGYPVTISSSGAYRLTSSLLQTEIPGFSTPQTAIQISADGVDLDLGGFRIACSSAILGTCSGGGHGVLVSGKAARIRNGSIDGMPGSGIYATSPGAVIEDMRVANSGLSGISTSTSARITRCTALSNGNSGISASGRSSITASVSEGNATRGISTIASLVSGNVVTANLGDGIRAFNSSIRDNQVSFNDGIGIDASIGSNLTGNVVIGNDDVGADLGSSSVYRDNQFRNNGLGTVTGGINAGGNACDDSLVCP